MRRRAPGRATTTTLMPWSGLSVDADRVEGAAEPAGGLERRPHDAAAPVGGRVEVGLVGVGEVHRREHGHLALVVQRLQPGEGGVPAELGRARRPAGWCSGAIAEAAAQRAVLRVGQRDERVEPVVAAVEVQRDEDRGVRRLVGLGRRPPRARRAWRGRRARWCRSTGPRRARAGCARVMPALARSNSCEPVEGVGRDRRPPRRRGRGRRGGWRASRAQPRTERGSSAASSADLGVGAGQQQVPQHALALGEVVLDLPLVGAPRHRL